MSDIEKALKKYKKNLKEKAENKSKDNEQKGKGKNNVHKEDVTKNGPVYDSFTLDSPPKKKNEKFTKRDSLITSAVKKKEDGKTNVIDSLTRHDNYDNLKTDRVDFAPPIDEITRKEQDLEDTSNSTVIDSFNVDKSIVSYYDFIGKQVWEGPVMVHFRRLQLVLQKAHNEKCKVIAFASADQGEGKSLIALNTAITLCNDKLIKVAILDCDFRKTAINKLLEFNPEKGLADYLSEELDIKDVSFTGIVPRLTIIPAGNKPPNVHELLASNKMKQFISFLKETFDYVIIDTPPILAFPDTQVISPLSDGVVLIIDSKKTKTGLAKRAVESLHDCKVIGCVMNNGEASSTGYYSYNYAYQYK